MDDVMIYTIIGCVLWCVVFFVIVGKIIGKAEFRNFSEPKSGGVRVMHQCRTGMTDATWAGSPTEDTWACEACGKSETVQKGNERQDVRWTSGDGYKTVHYRCNDCAK